MKFRNRTAITVLAFYTFLLSFSPKVSAQTCPSEIGSLASGRPEDLAVVGSLVLAAEGDDPLAIYDLSEPRFPVEIARVKGALNQEHGFGISVLGDYAYVAGHFPFVPDGDLRVFDISDPSEPAVVGRGNTGMWSSKDLAIDAPYIYFAGGQHLLDGYFKFSVFDIQNPVAPSEEGAVHLADPLLDVALQGSIAYLAGTDSGLHVVDVSDPSDPRVLSSTSHTDVQGVAIDGRGLVYLAAGSGGLRIVNAQAPASPFEVGFWNDAGYAVNIEVLGNTAYLVDSTFGLRIIDISDPTTPVQTGSVATPGEARDVALFGDYAVIADKDAGIRVIDISCHTEFYVALGDSYSSGEGTGEYEDETDKADINMCHVSPFAWTTETPGRTGGDIVPGFKEMSHYSYACSGALMADLSNDSHRTEWDDAPGPQLREQLVPSADLITISIGGNDSKFADVIKQCTFWSLVGNCWEDDFPGDEQNRSFLEVVEDSITELRFGGLRNAYCSVKDKAKGAPLVVIGYPNVVPDLQEGEGGWSVEEARTARIFADELWEAIQFAADDAGVHTIDVRWAFDGHEALTDEPFINDLLQSAVVSSRELQESYHPNNRGQRAYAKAVVVGIHAIRKYYPDLGYKPTDNCPVVESLISTAAEASALPTMGELSVVPETPLACIGQIASAVPGESVSLTGHGFEPLSLINLEVLFEAVEPESLGSAATDDQGTLETVITLPSGPPSEGLALFRASGLGSNGEARLLNGFAALGASLEGDADDDGFPDICDNCPVAANADQADTDYDGLGDACDTCPADTDNDWDGDGLCSDNDQCPYEPVNDADNDGFCATVDNCPLDFNPNQEDSDLDYVGDACDDCPGVSDFHCQFSDDFESGSTSGWSVVVGGTGEATCPCEFQFTTGLEDWLAEYEDGGCSASCSIPGYYQIDDWDSTIDLYVECWKIPQVVDDVTSLNTWVDRFDSSSLACGSDHGTLIDSLSPAEHSACMDLIVEQAAQAFGTVCYE